MLKIIELPLHFTELNNKKMIEKILKNIAYSYYPKGLCSLKDNDSYILSNEFKALSTTINSLLEDKDYQNSRNSLLAEFSKHDSIREIEDLTTDKHDRCLRFEIQIFEGNTLIRICLNISLLLPYYFIYALKNDIELEPKYRWLNLPERDNQSEVKFSKEMNLLEKIVNKQTNFTKFPEDLIEKIIPEINYADIELGDFTYYNAFFIDNLNLS